MNREEEQSAPDSATHTAHHIDAEYTETTKAAEENSASVAEEESATSAKRTRNFRWLGAVLLLLVVGVFIVLKNNQYTELSVNSAAVEQSSVEQSSVPSRKQVDDAGTQEQPATISPDQRYKERAQYAKILQLEQRNTDLKQKLTKAEEALQKASQELALVKQNQVVMPSSQSDTAPDTAPDTATVPMVAEPTQEMLVFYDYYTLERAILEHQPFEHALKRVLQHALPDKAKEALMALAEYAEQGMPKHLHIVRLFERATKQYHLTCSDAARAPAPVQDASWMGQIQQQLGVFVQVRKILPPDQAQHHIRKARTALMHHHVNTAHSEINQLSPPQRACFALWQKQIVAVQHIKDALAVARPILLKELDNTLIVKPSPSTKKTKETQE